MKNKVLETEAWKMRLVQTLVELWSTNQSDVQAILLKYSWVGHFKMNFLDNWELWIETLEKYHRGWTKKVHSFTALQIQNHNTYRQIALQKVKIKCSQD